MDFKSIKPGNIFQNSGKNSENLFVRLLVEMKFSKDSSLAEIEKTKLNSELVEAVTKGRLYSGGFSKLWVSNLKKFIWLYVTFWEPVKVAKVLSKGADPNFTVCQDSDILSMCHLAVRQQNISILSLLTSYRFV